MTIDTSNTFEEVYDCGPVHTQVHTQDSGPNKIMNNYCRFHESLPMSFGVSAFIGDECSSSW